MKKESTQPGLKPKSERERWLVEPDDEIKSMVKRAMRAVAGDNCDKIHGLRHHILIKALTEGLVKQGFARKKELAALESKQ